jgi:hypothetical protein
MNGQSDSNPVVYFFASLSGILLFLLFVIWVVCAIIAAVVAPDDRRVTFFWLTFFFGFFGIWAAAIASPRTKAGRPAPPGKRRVYCIRCDAPQNIPIDATEFTCWQCSQQMGFGVPSTSGNDQQAPPNPGTPTTQPPAFLPGRFGLDWRNAFK